MPLVARLAAVIVLLAAGTTAARSAAAAASASEPTLSTALARLQAGDAAGAARALRVITIRESRSAQAWRALGTAEQQRHNHTSGWSGVNGNRSGRVFIISSGVVQHRSAQHHGNTSG